MSTLGLGLFGRGRLATAIVEAAPVAGIDLCWQGGRGESPWPSCDRPAAEIDPVIDVVIDASVGEAVPAHLDLCLARGLPLVVAATGWEIPDLGHRVAERGAVLVAPNGSLTLALMRRFATILGAWAQQVPGGEGFLYDHHHSAKRDAPSGTARALDAAWRRGAQGSSPQLACLRAGHEIGTHALGFDAPGEVFEIRHRARSRALFADGLLQAAVWLHRRWSEGHRGLYTLDDVASAALDPLFRQVTQASSHDFTER